MDVGEIIKQLQQLNEDMEVTVVCENFHWEIKEIAIDSRGIHFKVKESE